MRLASRCATGILLGGLPALARPAAAHNDTWALINADIETVSRGASERGTIVIRRGQMVLLTDRQTRLYEHFRARPRP